MFCSTFYRVNLINYIILAFVDCLSFDASDLVEIKSKERSAYLEYPKNRDGDAPKVNEGAYTMGHFSYLLIVSVRLYIYSPKTQIHKKIVTFTTTIYVIFTKIHDNDIDHT
jgi:hypothetical protein